MLEPAAPSEEEAPFFSLLTSLSPGLVLERVRRGDLGSASPACLHEAASSGWTGQWCHGSFLLQRVESDELSDVSSPLIQEVRHTFQTCLRLNFHHGFLVEVLEKVHRTTACVLHSWEGNLALLYEGHFLDVLRSGGALHLQDDCIKPRFLAFYNDLPWTALPLGD